MSRSLKTIDIAVANGRLGLKEEVQTPVQLNEHKSIVLAYQPLLGTGIVQLQSAIQQYSHIDYEVQKLIGNIDFEVVFASIGQASEALNSARTKDREDRKKLHAQVMENSGSF